MKRRNFFYLLSTAVVASQIKESVLGQAQHSKTIAPIERPKATYVYPYFDLSQIPFSCAGSYHVVSIGAAAGDYRLRFSTVRKAAITHRYQTGASWSHDVLELALLKNGVELKYATEATPTTLLLRAGDAGATVAFYDQFTFVIEAHACDIELRLPRRLTWTYFSSRDRFRGFDFQSQHSMQIEVDHGKELSADTRLVRRPDGDTLLIPGDRNVAAVLRMTPDEELETLNLATVEPQLKARKAEFKVWMDKQVTVPPEYSAAAQTAWFLFWNLQVSPYGGYSRQTVLSSKRSMSQIWSWDNCFNALALAHADPKLAWDQIFVILDKQKPNGLLPDTVSDLEPLFGFNKPPIWGWALDKLIARTPESDRKIYIAEAYPKVAKYHRWWFQYRDLFKNGLPCYMTGNDSGWDNSTIFDEPWPVQSPDLTALLILQGESLSLMARALGKLEEAAQWRQEAEQLLDRFKQVFVRGDALTYSVLLPEGPQVRASSSLLTRIPLVLGSRLPAGVRRRLIAELGDEKQFLAPSGPASESLASPKYESNGYWRGPVWGPSTLLIHDGLVSCGESALAETIARRFCDTCAREATFRENYNAVNGVGQFDSGMTWSAADFLLLAEGLKRA